MSSMHRHKIAYKEALEKLAGDMGTGGAPSVEIPFGPSAGGTVYTDHATILAVQKALKARGYSPGKIDGIFGKDTEDALFRFSFKHGPPDDGTLAKLGVKPGGAGDSAPAVSSGSFSPSKIVTSASTAGPSMPGEKVSWISTNVPGLNRPLWQVMLGGLGATAIGVGLYSVLRSRK